MSIFHNSTRVNRQPEVRDTATAGLRSNCFKASIIKKWLCVVLCLVFVFSALGVAVPQAAHAADEGYLFDKVITWADGTQEHVQIDQDGFFVLNGIRKRLIGMCTTIGNFETGNFWDAGNLAILHSELDYLMSKSVRIVEVQFSHSIDYDNNYDGILQLCFDHKMLVLATVSYQWFVTANGYLTGFNDLSTADFQVKNPEGGTEAVSIAIAHWVAKYKSYSNVVMASFENELDLDTYSGGYAPANAANYIRMGVGIVKGATNIPVTSKLTDNLATQAFINMHNAIYPFLSIPCFDFYCDSGAAFTTSLDAMKVWYNSKGKTTQMWATEVGALCPGGYDSASMTKAMIDAMLAANASVVLLFPANGYNLGAANSGYFDYDGVARANTDVLFTTANMATWQVAISPPATTPTDTSTITASAGANGSISPSGAVTINHGAGQSFTITTDAGYRVAVVLVDGASVGAVTSYTFSNVTANHTISASFAATGLYQ